MVSFKTKLNERIHFVPSHLEWSSESLSTDKKAESILKYKDIAAIEVGSTLRDKGSCIPFGKVCDIIE